MATELAKAFIKKLKESPGLSFYAYIQDREDDVCIDGWFEMSDLDRILQEIVDERKADDGG